MKKNALFLLPLTALLAVGCAPTSEPTSDIPSTEQPTTVVSTPVVEEGKLYIKNYVQYLSYNPTRIQKMMDKVDTPSLDLYYFIVDEEVSTIENDHIIAKKSVFLPQNMIINNQLYIELWQI